MRSDFFHHGRPGLQAQNQVRTVKAAAIASEIPMFLVNVSPTLMKNARNSRPTLSGPGTPSGGRSMFDPCMRPTRAAAAVLQVISVRPLIRREREQPQRGGTRMAAMSNRFDANFA